MTSNRWATEAFRNEVLAYLFEQGLTNASPPPRGLKLSQRIGSMLTGDIVGLDPWVIGVRNAKTHDLPGAQDSLRAEALLAGTPWYASIQSRSGRRVADAYVTVPLSIFTRILAGERPRQLENSSSESNP